MKCATEDDFNECLEDHRDGFVELYDECQEAIFAVEAQEHKCKGDIDLLYDDMEL